jgi:hypothetical protein
MGAPLAARPTCACCASPMDEVETVAVLASLQGHTVYECEWCHHITLVAERTAPADGARWLSASSLDCRLRNFLRDRFVTLRNKAGS